MTDRSNLVLICVEQWRGDCLSIDGHSVVHTPYLDEMASKGTRFRRAYTAVPSCIASRAALFTGLSQRSHGRVGYQDGVAWNYPTTLAGEFTRHGYQTQAIGKMHVYPERSQVGFQNVILHDGPLPYARRHNPNYDLVDDYLPWLRQQLGRDADDWDHGIFCNSFVARPWDKPEYVHPTDFVVSQALGFLRRRDPRKPFFLYLSFHRPHPPYDPPAWAFEQYLYQAMPEVPVGDWIDMFADQRRPYRHDAFFAQVAPDILQRARAGYYGHQTHIDHQINRFLEALRVFDLYDNTYFCFVADHGELLGDHHMFRKCLPYEGSARVPFILRGPHDSGIRRGAACNALVELRDVMPTLLDCAGLPIPESVEGHSLLPIARGEAEGVRSTLHSEHTLFGQSIQWLTDGHEKYIWFSQTGQEQLFNLDDDPQELHDLAGRPASADRLAHWRGSLVEELMGREEGFTDGKRLIPGRPGVPVLAHVLRQADGGT
jgi:arylsulfatase